MANTEGPSNPSPPTVKRLFAVSGNSCAFPTCPSPLIDLETGSVICQICHIRGKKPGAPRYDDTQTNEERHGFENLILLCNIHHKIVDDDEATFTVERLIQMKQDHEARNGSKPADKALSERIVGLLINNAAQGSVITSYGQQGGQTAHTIINYHGHSMADEPVQLDAKLDMVTDLEMIRALGCPGMRLTVICRSSRQAKIKSAHLLIDNVKALDAFEKGFDAKFPHTPLEGSTEVLDVELIPLSRPNSQEGSILNLDDVVRFFYPLPVMSTGFALRAKPDDLSITIIQFDNTERTILTGQKIKSVLEDVFRIFHKKPGECNATVTLSVRVKSTTPLGPEVADLMGKVNPNPVSFTRPDDKQTTRSEEKPSSPE